MLRSLFIGFLILSALTSKGVGVQIRQDVSLSADMLLQLYNAAVAQADRQSGVADKNADGEYFRSAAGNALTIEELLRSPGHDSQIVWALPDAPENCRIEQCKKSSRHPISDCMGEIYSFGSDTSPPF